jgi:hypothetical protein
MLVKRQVSDKLALLCLPEPPCTINHTQIGTGFGLEPALIMENVVVSGPVEPHPPIIATGSPLNIDRAHVTDAANTMLQIDKGSVTGTNLTSQGGRSMNGAGCVSNYGTFHCTDCIFTDCQAEQYGGAVESKGHLNLVRPVFLPDNICGTHLHPGDVKPCGSACWCISKDASRCVGCACKTHPEYGWFYCDA